MTMETLFSAKKIHLHIIVIMILSISVLWFGSKYLWTGNLNTTALGHTMNDQVGYVTASRNLAEAGELEGSLYYPALIKYYKSHNLLYMPGNYYIRTLFFYIFGYSIFTAFLPNLLAFIGSVILLFLIANQIYNMKTAYFASILFSLFTPFVLYSFSAMIEIIFVFACLLSFYFFIKLPKKAKITFGGLTILFPFLIRESAVLMLPGYAIMILFENDEKRYLKAFLFLGISVVLILLAKSISFISDIPPHFYLSLVNIRSLYTDAYALGNTHLVLTDIINIALNNIYQNIIVFKAILATWPLYSLDFTFFLSMLSLSLACVIVTIKNREINKSFAYFSIITALAVLSLIFSVQMYFVSYKGLRQLLFVVPFLLSVISNAIISSKMRKKVIFIALAMIFIVWSSLFYFSLKKFNKDFIMANAYDKKCNEFLDSIGVLNTKFFVAPHDISLDYVNLHYPIKWSFIPDNEETLKLLTDNYQVDMLIIPLGHNLSYEKDSLKVRTRLLENKFSMIGTKFFVNQLYLIYTPSH